MQGEDLTWRKSTYSSGNGGECVEVANHNDGILVRDTKDRGSGPLAVDAADWRRFVGQLKTRTGRGR